MDNLYTNNLPIERYVRRLLGPEIAWLLQDGKTQEISVNADGRIRIDDGSGDEFLVEGSLKPSDIETAVRMIAAVNGIWLDADAPFLNTVLLCGARCSAALPPIADGAQLSIRTHVRILRPLTAFMDERQAGWVKEQMRKRRNIIVAGGTNTGKTTLINALINEGIPDYNERLAVIEDAAELQIDGRRNLIRRLANSKADMKRHVFEILRARPDRIIVSEVRGAEAYDMVDALRTGHSGCLSTVHANSAAQAITRIAGLAGLSREIVCEGIQAVLFLERGEDGRRRLTGIEELQALEPAIRRH